MSIRATDGNALSQFRALLGNMPRGGKTSELKADLQAIVRDPGAPADLKEAAKFFLANPAALEGLAEAEGLEDLSGEGEVEDEHTAAHALARRRKLGPYRPGERAPYREKDLAAMARAGFSYGIAREIIDGEPLD